MNEALFASISDLEAFEKLGAGARQRKAEAPWSASKKAGEIVNEALFASISDLEAFEKLELDNFTN